MLRILGPICIWMIVLPLLLPIVARAEMTGADPVVIDGTKFPINGTLEVCGPCEKKDFYDLTPCNAVLRAVRFDGKGNQDEILVYLNAAPKAADVSKLTEGRVTEDRRHE
jgi:hypothetical protein